MSVGGPSAVQRSVPDVGREPEPRGLLDVRIDAWALPAGVCALGPGVVGPGVVGPGVRLIIGLLPGLRIRLRAATMTPTTRRRRPHLGREVRDGEPARLPSGP